MNGDNREKNRIRLSDDFTYGRIIRFSMPSVLMTICTSLYSIVDSFFISNYAGKNCYAAVAFVFPVLMVISAIGFMTGTGGAALIGKTLGEKKPELAHRYLSEVTIFTAVSGVIISFAAQFLLGDLLRLLGCGDDILGYCLEYGHILLAGMPFFMLQFLFQPLFTTAEKPKLGFTVTIAAGLANVVLDYLLVAVLGTGVAGAAIATVMSQVTGGLLPVIYFMRPNSSLLRFARPKAEYRPVLRICANGSSEFLSSAAASVVAMLYNAQLLKFAGTDGVAAYGIINDTAFVFSATFLGYVVGVAPIVSFNFGAQNRDGLKNIYRKSLILISCAGIVMMVLEFISASLLAGIFAGYDTELKQLTVHAVRIYSLSFLFSGFNIFGSSFFSALNDAVVSAVISSVRIFIFEIGMVLVLPVFFGIDGIWFSIAAAELGCLMVTFMLLSANKGKYGYA